MPAGLNDGLEADVQRGGRVFEAVCVGAAQRVLQLRVRRGRDGHLVGDAQVLHASTGFHDALQFVHEHVLHQSAAAVTSPQHLFLLRGVLYRIDTIYAIRDVHLLQIKVLDAVEELRNEFAHQVRLLFLEEAQLFLHSREAKTATPPYDAWISVFSSL